MPDAGNNSGYFPSFDFASFLYQIQRGAVPGYIYKQRHAFCHELSSSFFHPIWSISPPSTYNYLVAAQTLQISSTNANDTAVGTGARTVLISGLDANYDTQTETITLNGQTGVTTVKSYLRINDLAVQTFGTDRRNRGDIYLGSGVVSGGGVNSIPQSLINAGAMFSEVGVVTVPRGFTLISFDYNVAVSAGKEATVRGFYRPNATAPFISQGGTSVFAKRTDSFQTTTGIFYEFSDIQLQGIANMGNTKITVDVQTALVQNGYV